MGWDGFEPPMLTHARGLQPRPLPLWHQPVRLGQYRASRNRKVVWVARFELAASRFQGEPSTGLTLHPEIDGRGREVMGQS